MNLEEELSQLDFNELEDIFGSISNEISVLESNFPCLDFEATEIEEIRCHIDSLNEDRTLVYTEITKRLERGEVNEKTRTK